jgi:type IV secretory pathway VirB9-like protein
LDLEKTTKPSANAQSEAYVLADANPDSLRRYAVCYHSRPKKFINNSKNAAISDYN